MFCSAPGHYFIVRPMRRVHRLPWALLLMILLSLSSVSSFFGHGRESDQEGVEGRESRGLRGSTLDAAGIVTKGGNSEIQKENFIESSSNDKSSGDVDGDISFIGRILQVMPGAPLNQYPGATPDDPIGLWHVSSEDIEKYAPPLLGGKNMNYGASSAAKAAELAARAAAGVQSGIVTSGSNNILPSVGHRGGHGHHGRVDIFALARRKKAAMEAKAAAAGVVGVGNAAVAEMPGKMEDEKLKHVPASFDEFDGKTGEFLKSSNMNFPLSATHHGAKDEQEVAAAAMAAIGGHPAPAAPVAPAAPAAPVAPVAPVAPAAAATLVAPVAPTLIQGA